MPSHDPYAEIKALCTRMESDGVSPDTIIDALLVTGMNAGRIMSGDDHMAAWLHRMAVRFEARANHQPPPPRLTQ
jgi:hypothetical protein